MKENTLRNCKQESRATHNPAGPRKGTTLKRDFCVKATHWLVFYNTLYHASKCAGQGVSPLTLTSPVTKYFPSGEKASAVIVFLKQRK